eukprot:SAG31_NODE_2759_length_5134_cov_5.037736_3_plen_81_part_00
MADQQAVEDVGSAEANRAAQPLELAAVAVAAGIPSANDGAKYLKISRNVSKYLKMYQNVSKFAQQYTSSRCPDAPTARSR